MKSKWSYLAAILVCVLVWLFFYTFVFPNPNPAELFISFGTGLAAAILSRRVVLELLSKHDGKSVDDE